MKSIGQFLTATVLPDIMRFWTSRQKFIEFLMNTGQVDFMFQLNHKSFDYYKQISMISTEETNSSFLQNLGASQRQYFECPCGKEYRSYPALFTHIKNKHEGKAPGQIKKPFIAPKKKGRPPVNKINQYTPCGSEVSQVQPSTSFSLQVFEDHFQDPSSLEHLLTIAKILNLLPEQRLNRLLLNEISTIHQMNFFLMSKRGQQYGLFIGNVLQSFFVQISSQVQWQKFQHIFTLILLLVHYVSTELKNSDIISEGSIDLLCDYINDFIQIGLSKLTQVYKINDMHLFKSENVIDVFQAFFQWLMCKKYTNYKISLNASFKKMETASDF